MKMIDRKAFGTGVLLCLFLLAGVPALSAQGEEAYMVRSALVAGFLIQGDRKVGKEIESKFREVLAKNSFLVVLESGSSLKPDAVISGSINLSEKSFFVSVVIKNSVSGLPLATESISIPRRSAESLEKGLSNLVSAITSRLPAKGKVTEIADHEVTVDTGGLDGLEEGAAIHLFRIKGATRHPFTHEIVSYEKIPVAEAVVTSITPKSARAKVTEEKSPVQRGDLVGFPFSRKTADRYRTEAAPPSGPLVDPSLQPGSTSTMPARQEHLASALPAAGVSSPGRGWAELGVQFLQNRYHFSSVGLNFSRDTSGVPSLQADFGYWIWKRLGVELFFQAGWIQYHDPNGAQRVIGNPYWVVPRLVVRTPSIGSVQTKVALGYSVYSLSYAHGDRTFFVDSNVTGPEADVELWGRIGDRVTYRFFGSVEPFQRVSESPVTSGSSGTVIGYALEGRGGWALTPRFLLEAGYLFRADRYHFSGVGSRGNGVSGSVASDLYSGPLLELRYEF